MLCIQFCDWLHCSGNLTEAPPPSDVHEELVQAEMLKVQPVLWYLEQLKQINKSKYFRIVKKQEI